MTPRSPKDLSPAALVSQMIRVDHAGEYGAVRIYEGQRTALKGQAVEPLIQDMQAHEQEHLKAFEKLIQERRIRPTILMPVWHLAGFALGYITGKLGEKAAMACTVAVEEVIDEHYAQQERALTHLPQESALKEVVTQFRQEELAHRAIGLEKGAQDIPLYPLLTGAIKAASRLAIFLSKRL